MPEKGCCVTLVSTSWPAASSSSPRSRLCFPPRRRPASRRSRSASSHSAASGRSARHARRARSSSSGSTGAARGGWSCGHATRRPLVAVAAGARGRRGRPRQGERPSRGRRRLARGCPGVGGSCGWAGGAGGRSGRARPRVDGAQPRLEGPAAAPPLPRDCRRSSRGAAGRRTRRSVRASPSYADTLRMAHVHHTAGTNTYTRLQAPAVVRAIQVYHVKGNGWNDIGYNALVDRFGTVYEGRFGGIDRNVVGRTRAGSTRVVRDRRDGRLPHRRAAGGSASTRSRGRSRGGSTSRTSTRSRRSTGSRRATSASAPGSRCSCGSISGHRDTGLTTCPGERLYGRCRRSRVGWPRWGCRSSMRRRRHPTSRAASGSRRLSSSLPWSGRRDRRSRHRARPRRGHGHGGRLDVAPASPVPAGAHWRIESPGATPAEGARSATATTLQLTDASAVAGDDLAQRRRAGGHDGDLVHAHRDAANVTVTVADPRVPPWRSSSRAAGGAPVRAR